jgi:integrase
VPGHQPPDIEVWDDPVVVAVIDAHPDELRAIPELAASLGMREGELFGPAEEDLDLDQEQIVRVRRQVKRIGRVFVFALPKNDRERVIPMSDWDVQVIRQHISQYPPRPVRCPGRNRTANRTPAACCFAGLPTISTSSREATQKPSGSPP